MIDDISDFEELLHMSVEEKQLTTTERGELDYKLTAQAEIAHKAIGDWLTTFKRLGYWSSCDEDLGCIIHAYRALKNPDSE
jgi:hypothetical protein